MNKEIEAQQVVVKNLLSLVQENPELRILPLVDTDCVASDDYGSWVAKWGHGKIDYVWSHEGSERIFIKSDDFDELVNELTLKAYVSEEKANQIVEEYEWEKVILVNIVP